MHSCTCRPRPSERSTRGDALGFGQRRVQISARAVEAEATGAGHVSCQRALQSAENWLNNPRQSTHTCPHIILSA
jgi:hypothetical protein